jgi:hypothetical protein
MSFRGDEAISSGGVTLAACPGIGRLGLSGVDVTLTLLPDGTGWTGRPSTTAGGDIEVHFEQAGANEREILVSATARGTAIDSDSSLKPPGQRTGDARIVLGSAAQLPGSVIRNGAAGSGMVTTAVTFRNLNGDIAACAPNTVPWFLSRLGL